MEVHLLMALVKFTLAKDDLDQGIAQRVYFHDEMKLRQNVRDAREVLEAAFEVSKKENAH